MRVKSATIQQFILGLALLLALCWNLAQANEINELQVTSGPTGTRAELRLRTGVAYTTFSLSGPDRLVVDLPGTSAARNFRLPSPTGVVKAVRRGQPAPGITRIVFDLSTPVAVLKPRLESDAQGARLILEWPGDGPIDPIAAMSSGPDLLASTANAATQTSSTSTQTSTHVASSAVVTTASPPPAASSTASQTPPSAVIVPPTSKPAGVIKSAPATVVKPTSATVTKPAPTTVAKPAPVVASTPPLTTKHEPLPLPGKTLQDLRVGTRPLIIAIDAGHGGQDPGALGPSGKREKDITLLIARELARQVNATPGLKAYLTRDSDMFLPLTRRTQLARAAKADMFVSIHADAAENPAARGSSVFVLSLRGASSQRARWLADKENAADLIGGAALPRSDNTLTSVLLDLTQSGQMKASENAAAHVLGGLKGVGRTHKTHVERANFAVLRTSDMPAMLVETAFISNPEEERQLSDPDYQRALARAVLNGVNIYFTRQPPPGTLYAARANAAQEVPVQVAKAQTSTGGSP